MSLPCKDCKDRVIGCHASCPKYRAFYEKRVEMANLRAENRKKEFMFKDVERPQRRVWDQKKRERNELTRSRTK